MATLSQAVQIALEHYRSGRLPLADEICRRILDVEPNHADALNLRAAVAERQGRHADALQYAGRAVELDGRRAAFHTTLGAAYRGLGRSQAAAACFQRAVELEPTLAEAHYNLGLSWKDQGNLEAAIASYRRAVEFDPEFAPAWNNLGNALAGRKQTQKALACYQRALELQPRYVEALVNRARAYQDLGRPADAAASSQQALAVRSDFAPACNQLALALAAQGQLEAAVSWFQHALQLRPDYPEAYSNLGNVWTDLGRLDDAVHCHLAALQRKPDSAEILCNLGSAYRQQGCLHQAAECYRRAIALEPNSAAALNNLAGVWKDQGQPEEAVECYRRALKSAPDDPQTRSNYLCALRYHPDVGLAALNAAYAEYETRHAAPLRDRWRPHENLRDPERPLRLGFVSPSFARHPVGYFLLRTLEHFDRNECEMACYSDRIVADDFTARFRAAASSWHEVLGVGDAELAERIRADRIDVLFDLTGHAPRNRLLVFARKPAPIQITWIDSVGTTGLSAVDYVLAGPHDIPQSGEPYYTERVLRMPDSWICYEPPDAAPPVGPLPAQRRGYVQFASFNNPAKLHRRVLQRWADILHRVPGSRLSLRYRSLDDPESSRHFRETFAACGIDGDRLDLQGEVPHAQLLDCYNQVDVALDPFVYNGGLTTCEALWMGVPVVTCPGDTFVRRHSLGTLSAVGLTETIADNVEEYVDVAVRLAGDLARLADLRQALRRRVAQSPLCDGRRFAENLVAILRRVWREWAARQ